jgi:hypothetical protein
MIALLVAAAAAHAQEPKRGGELVLKNAVAGATVSLVRVPDAVKDMESVLRLWSENEPAIAEALVRLSDADAAFVTGRLRELSAVGPEKTTALAKKLAERVAPSPEAVEVVRRTVADINGLARFLDVPAGTFQLLSTRPASPDFLAIGIRTDGRGVVAIDCAAARLPKPAPEFVGSRVAVRSAGGPVKVVAGGKVVAEIASKEGEVIELQSPARLTVEPSGPVAPPLADGRVGMVQLVHHRYGVFIRLEPGVQLIAGESIAIYRDGAEVTRAEILLVCGSDEKYPDGAVQVSPGAEVKKGDEVRRVKP